MTTLLVSVPNQMPNDCVLSLAVNSATIVGMLVVELVDEGEERGRALVGVDVDVAGAEQIVGDRLQAASPIRPAGRSMDWAGLLGVNGAAKAPKLAVRPSSATIGFSFIEDSCQDESLHRASSASDDGL